jgi:hypothetical protein
MRRHPRVPCLHPVRISWEEQGQPRFAITKLTDVSESGLRIESSQPIPRGAIVMLESPRMNLRGAATVKHSIRRGAKFLLGLQLTQPLPGETVALIENFNRTDQKV